MTLRYYYGGATLLGLVIGYLLTTTPAIAGHLGACTFAIVFAQLLAGFIGP
jgi:hypothetical protein